MVKPAKIPDIDIAPFMAGDEHSKRQVAEAFSRACEDIGFVVISGHGIAQTIQSADRSGGIMGGTQQQSAGGASLLTGRVVESGPPSLALLQGKEMRSRSGQGHGRDPAGGTGGGEHRPPALEVEVGEHEVQGFESAAGGKDLTPGIEVDDEAALVPLGEGLTQFRQSPHGRAPMGVGLVAVEGVLQSFEDMFGRASRGGAQAQIQDSAATGPSLLRHLVQAFEDEGALEVWAPLWLVHGSPRGRFRARTGH